MHPADRFRKTLHNSEIVNLNMLCFADTFSNVAYIVDAGILWVTLLLFGTATLSDTTAGLSWMLVHGSSKNWPTLYLFL